MLYSITDKFLSKKLEIHSFLERLGLRKEGHHHTLRQQRHLFTINTNVYGKQSKI